jgi:DivIVA domain-containing protein
VLNPEDIRNASFSLLPTGYSPEQVDTVLNEAADAIASGNIGDFALQYAFEHTDVGYAPREVDQFLAKLEAELSGQTPESAKPVAGEEEPAAEIDGESIEEPDSLDESEPVSIEESENETDEDLNEGDEDADTLAESQATEVEDVASLDAGEDASDEHEVQDVLPDEVFAATPAETSWQAPADGVLDLDLLCQAVDRTGETLASLRSFIDNEVGAMKMAVERQAHETAKRCEQLIAEAVAQATLITEAANSEIERANKAAHSAMEKERRELAKELKRIREECDAQVTRKHADADAYAKSVRAEADRDRADAQRTIENAIGMQASIAESLERARQQLTPSELSDDELAA